MNYAIKLLKEEREFVLSSIKRCKLEGYSHALKDRKQHLQEIEQAINVCEVKLNTMKELNLYYKKLGIPHLGMVWVQVYINENDVKESSSDLLTEEEFKNRFTIKK